MVEWKKESTSKRYQERWRNNIHKITEYYGDKDIMSDNFECFCSDLFSVLAKERVLQKKGYHEKKSITEHQLDYGEYLVNAPLNQDISTLQGWEHLSICWCKNIGK